MHTHIHTHTHTHTHTHKYTHIHTHTYTNINMHMYILHTYKQHTLILARGVVFLCSSSFHRFTCSASGSLNNHSCRHGMDQTGTGCFYKHKEQYNYLMVNLMYVYRIHVWSTQAWPKSTHIVKVGNSLHSVIGCVIVRWIHVTTIN